MEIIESLKAHYNIHPLMFRRSLERCPNPTDLFDLLDTMPDQYPMILTQQDGKYQWEHTDDLFQAKNFVK